MIPNPLSGDLNKIFRPSDLLGWQKDKRPLIYVFTGDLTPNIERRALQVGFKKTFSEFRTQQMQEILNDIFKRDMELKQIGSVR